MVRPLFALLLLLGSTVLAIGQPANDDCADAILIDNPSNYCSDGSLFSNEEATASNFGPASCFSDEGRDVWFSFVPIATTVTVTILGNNDPNYTLAAPEAALYSGSCEQEIFEWRCVTDDNNGIVEFTRSGLAIGERYYIRVQGRNNGAGTFQLCLRNFNPPVEPGQDCGTMSVLCNKEAFVVQKVSGPGEDPTEANDASCFESALGGADVESASTWFTWTAVNDGSLTFDLIPLNPSDDLDFALYELPNGLGNCDDKILVRCMASSCFGPTGLRDGEIDLGEPPNCDDPRQNNYLMPLEMEEGKSYALMVNNFSETGNGFDVQFGGSGLFQGPEVEITSSEADSTVCVGDPITFDHQSNFPPESITEWAWDFGPTASDPTLEGEGPHTVLFNRPGRKSAVLTITTDEGCRVTEVLDVLVEPCCANTFQVEAEISDETCANIRNGGIDLTVSGGTPPYIYNWSNGVTTEDLLQVPPGTYELTLTDQSACDTTLTFTVETAPPFTIEQLLSNPSCDGGQDGAIELLVEGGTAPYLFDWEGGGFSPDNRLDGLPAGDYQVIIRDQNDCRDTLTIPLRELDVQIDSARSVIDPPACAGGNSGTIALSLIGGQPPYLLDWNDGLGFRDVLSRSGLPAGTYRIEVLDANRCRGLLTIDLQAPPSLQIDPDVLDASCANTADGEISVHPSGGARPYAFALNNQPADSVITGLPAGSYTLRLRDANGCILERAVRVGAPPAIDGRVAEAVDARCFGEASGQLTLAASGGTEPYLFSTDGAGFQTDPTFGNLRAGAYQFVIQDAQGCFDTLIAQVQQPPELIADAGADVEISLGSTVQLQATSSDPAAAFSWSPPETLDCIECASPEAFPLQHTTYVLQAVDPSGCVALDSVQVRIAQDRPVYFPNAFSPNGDGQNDYFGVFGGPGLRQVRALRIFDRWGNLLFERENLPVNDATAGWDGRARGRDLTTGVYVFLAEVEFIDDTVVEYGGDILLLR